VTVSRLWTVLVEGFDALEVGARASSADTRAAQEIAHSGEESR
jgi:hypothetical protein